MPHLSPRCLLAAAGLCLLWQPGRAQSSQHPAAPPSPAPSTCLIPETWLAHYNSGVSGDDRARAIVVDEQGDVYVTGASDSRQNELHDFATVKYDARTGQQLWAARYAGPAHQEDVATAIAVDRNGNVYVTGYSSNGSNTDYVTIKYNAQTGQQRWLARYNGPANADDEAIGLAVDAAGDAYVTGASVEGTGGANYVTLKYDGRTGRASWRASYNGPANQADTPVGIALSPAGSVYVTGSSYCAADYDYATVQYDGRTGRQQWAARFGGTSGRDDRAAGLAVDAAGDVYVTGSSVNAAGNADYATVKYDERTGQPRWVARYAETATSADVATGIAVDQAGNAYVTGSSDGLRDPNAPTPSPPGSPLPAPSPHYATLRYSARTGQPRWVARYFGAQVQDGFITDTNDIPVGVALDAAGDVYVTGTSDVPFRTITSTLKYDKQRGRELWLARGFHQGYRSVTAVALAVSAQGDAYVTGLSLNTGPEYVDFGTVKYSRHSGCPTATPRPGTSAPVALEAFPNPATATTTLRFRQPATGPAQVQVYNQYGTLVATPTTVSTAPDGWQTLTLPTAALPNGVYLCRLLHDHQVEQLRLQVQH
ncbi:SBBP repeat-containing protein [Hymenobacter convexus]|uniref:SBBP repeat-containing protein n=1 Tax=Hymenobacter sp. CA1UV-4 TaxID=3063782 RepID=UPI002713A557|nr:SBBP repeat-containing protein [Hymenobacter sp. CA1UV-4]MDO7852465.1 SBBP repeat-containing protein [Hymenobacter sp. CA1UV-4]